MLSQFYLWLHTPRPALEIWKFFTKLCLKTQAVKEGCFKFASLFLKKSWAKSWQNVELNLCMLETAVAYWNHSCYGWPFLAKNITQNRSYFDEIKSFCKLIIWFHYFCKKNFFWVWPIGTPVLCKLGQKW